MKVSQPMFMPLCVLAFVIWSQIKSEPVESTFWEAYSIYTFSQKAHDIFTGAQDLIPPFVIFPKCWNEHIECEETENRR